MASNPLSLLGLIGLTWLKLEEGLVQHFFGAYTLVRIITISENVINLPKLTIVAW